jgi:hypothetical protein
VPYFPTVSFLCPTYGRAAKQPHLINEMLYWFTRQDHPKCELVVLNDAAGQELWTKVPNVRCVNWPDKIPTLGEKMNTLVDLARGAICVVSEDDDVSLPHRASQAAAMLEGYDYWNPRLWCYAPLNQPAHIDGNGWGHNCAAFRRNKFRGRYEAVSQAHDAKADTGAVRDLRTNPKKVTPEEVSYVYRWAVSDLHLSAQQDMETAYKHNAPGPPGRYELVPFRGVDWVSVAAGAKR